MASLHLAVRHSYRHFAVPAETLYGQNENATLSISEVICSIRPNVMLSGKEALKSKIFFEPAQGTS
jgi:hypothetical protein